MDIVEKIFEIREEDLVAISTKEKEEILAICPHYYGTSKLESLLKGNSELEKAFDDFFIKTNLLDAYFNKKYYLAGLKDGINIFEFIKGDKK